MKKILVLCCVASLFCGCSRFLEEYSQDLAKVETFSDLDEVLLGKGYLPSGRFENNTYGVSPVNAFFQATHHMADELAFNERSNIGDLAGIQPQMFGWYTWQQSVGLPYEGNSRTSESRDWKQAYSCINICNMVLASVNDLSVNNQVEELQKKQTSYEEVCQHYLSILLLQLHRITGKEFSFAPPTDIPYECQRAKAYIEEHFHEPVTLERIAAIVHWDKFNLSHQFSAAFSVSPINYLLQLRITHSKRLLCDTDYSITQIAESSGFSSQNYFTQAFKKLVGVSPRAYRQKHQK